MKKQTSHRQLNKMAKGALAVVLAGSFTFTASQAFAAETTNQQDQYETVDLQSGTNPAANTTAQTTQTQDSPSLLPGDFFYFAKTAFEKIQLALTFDDVKEAKLLAGFASERLAEAHALFASGDQETAIKTINQALKEMKDADTIVDSQKTTDQVNNDQKETDQQSSNTDETKKGNEQSNPDQIKTDDQTNSETSKDDQEVSAVKDTLTHNIVALNAAMEKVKNPVAKAALQRNIDKTYAKLAKKLAKANAHLAKKQAMKAESGTEQTPVHTDENTNVTADTSVTTNSGVENTDASRNVNIAADTATSSSTKEHEQPVKQAHQEWKQVQQTAKQEVKHVQQAAKQQVHQKQAEVKSLVEAKKAEVKQTENEGKEK